MPRTFTRSEREYMARLVARNYEDREAGPEFSVGLETPMPADERMRRKRIRDKADTAVRDLVVASKAGVIELGELLKDHQLGSDLALNEAEEWEDCFRIALGSPPEDVEIEESDTGEIDVQIQTESDT